MRGRFAKEWGLLHCTQPGPDHHHHSTWTTDVIDFIFTQWWHLWELRNHDRHGRDLVSQQQATARQVNRELQMFYEDYGTHAPQNMQWLFDTPIEVQRQRPATAIRQWLTTWAPYYMTHQIQRQTLQTQKTTPIPQPWKPGNQSDGEIPLH